VQEAGRIIGGECENELVFAEAGRLLSGARLIKETPTLLFTAQIAMQKLSAKKEISKRTA